MLRTFKENTKQNAKEILRISYGNAKQHTNEMLGFKGEFRQNTKEMIRGF